MKRWRSFFAMAAILLCCGIAGADEETFSFAPFGKVYLYHGQKPPSGIVLFVSGDGGWNKGVIDMAYKLKSLGAVVVGVDIRQYLQHLSRSKEPCVYPAADFEVLSKYAQKKLNLPEYSLPVLVGYSSGATLVYAVLAQAPPNTFRGGISMGFCPDLDIRTSLCQGHGLISKQVPNGKGMTFMPSQNISAPWIVLQGTIDRACSVKQAELFTHDIPGAKIVLLPKVGHGFSVEKHWLPQLKSAYDQLAHAEGIPETVNTSLNDLPLVEIPAHGKKSDLFAVIISGDGGWAGLDREVGDALARHGIPVVGLNALKYFWTQRTPESASTDLSRIVSYYTNAWSKKYVILIGYSLGADVLPFMATRLPSDLRDRVREIVLLGPGKEAEFEFHFTEWLGRPDAKSALPVLPEVEKLRGRRILCLHGTGETNSLCPELSRDLARTIVMPGGHHFGGTYETIAEIILKDNMTTWDKNNKTE